MSECIGIKINMLCFVFHLNGIFVNVLYEKKSEEKRERKTNS